MEKNFAAMVLMHKNMAGTYNTQPTTYILSNTTRRGATGLDVRSWLLLLLTLQELNFPPSQTLFI